MSVQFKVPTTLLQQKTTASLVLLVQGSLIVIMLAMGLAYNMYFISVYNQVYICSVFFLFMFVCSLWSWKSLTGNIFNPYGLFLVAAVLFNGGQVLLEVFHLNEFGILGGEFPSEIILQTLLMVNGAIICMHTGALLCVLCRNRRPVKVVSTLSYHSPTTYDVSLVGWFLFLLSAPAAAIEITKSINIVMSSGYLALYQQPHQSGLENLTVLLSSFLAPSAIFMLVGSQGRRMDINISALIIICYSAASFFVGVRSAAILPLLGYTWAFHSYIRPISSKALLLTGVVLMIIVFPLVAANRNNVGENRWSVEKIKSTYLSIDNPAIAIITEMGTSMNTISHTMGLIPHTFSYDYGYGYLKALRVLVPSSIWPNNFEYKNYSDWLVWKIRPSVARNGGGYGYSFIAECYANFGWPGVLLIPFLLGYMLARLQLFVESTKDPARVALVGSTLAVFLVLARSESAMVVRSVLYFAVLPYLLTLLIAGIRRQRTTHREDTRCIESP